MGAIRRSWRSTPPNQVDQFGGATEFDVHAIAGRSTFLQQFSSGCSGKGNMAGVGSAFTLHSRSLGLEECACGRSGNANIACVGSTFTLHWWSLGLEKCACGSSGSANIACIGSTFTLHSRSLGPEECACGCNGNADIACAGSSFTSHTHTRRCRSLRRLCRDRGGGLSALFPTSRLSSSRRGRRQIAGFLGTFKVLSSGQLSGEEDVVTSSSTWAS